MCVCVCSLKFHNRYKRYIDLFVHTYLFLPFLSPHLFIYLYISTYLSLSLSLSLSIYIYIYCVCVCVREKEIGVGEDREKERVRREDNVQRYTGRYTNDGTERSYSEGRRRKRLTSNTSRAGLTYLWALGQTHQWVILAWQISFSGPQLPVSPGPMAQLCLLVNQTLNTHQRQVNFKVSS